MQSKVGTKNKKSRWPNYSLGLPPQGSLLPEALDELRSKPNAHTYNP